MRTFKEGKLLRNAMKGEINMVKLKTGGIILGGLAGYLILSKGLNVLSGMVKNVCNAREWKHYYKYGKDGNMCPPGYYKHTTTKGDGTEVEFGTQEAMKRDREQEHKDASKTHSDGNFGASFAKAIVDAISDGVKGFKASQEATEGDSEDKSEEDIFVCPHDCVNCIIPQDKCPHASCKPEGGVITKWNGDEPVAGRYPWTKDGMTQCEWSLETMPDREDVDGNAAKGTDEEELTPEEYADLDRKEDMEIESVHAENPDELDKTEE